jgi:hypothetical protein
VYKRQPLELARLRWLPLFEAALDALDHGHGLSALTLTESAALERVLQLRPDFDERIMAHVQRGRLRFAGWHVQPDFMRHDLETTIRNLSLGLEAALAFGRRPQAAILPTDSAPPQLAQILWDAGFESALWPTSDHGAGGQWAAPDGTYITVCGSYVYPEPLGDSSEPHIALLMPVNSASDLRILPTLPYTLRQQTGCDVIQTSAEGFLGASGYSAHGKIVTPGHIQPEGDPRFTALRGLETAFAAAYLNGQEQLKGAGLILRYAWRQVLQNAPGHTDLLNALAGFVPNPPMSPDMLVETPACFQITAVKLPDDGGSGLIVRGFNPNTEPCEVQLRPCQAFASADVVTAVESPTGGTLPAERDGTISFVAAGKRLLTFRFQPAST